MSLAFLSTDTGPDGPAATSPLTTGFQSAGARFDTHHGWNIATSFGDDSAELQALTESVGWADRSQLGKFELQGAPAELGELCASLGFGDLEPGVVAASATGRWLPLTPQRAIVLCEPGEAAEVRGRLGAAAVDVTASFAAIAIAGPLSRDLFARFCALDLRPREFPVGALAPGSAARIPAIVLREAGDRYLVIFGAAYSSYVWEVVSDAGERLGGRPAGANALAQATTQESADA